MAEDSIKTKGPLKSSQPDAGGANIYKVPVIGIVKDNIDPTRQGRIKVYIADKNGKDSDSSSNWITVSYLSTFFGKVTPTAPDTGLGTYKANPSSYGQWQAPPDIGSKVLCIFVNGDPNYGFYIGGIPEPEALQMVPAIGASDNIVANEGEANSFGGATRLPVTNINTNDKNVVNSTEYNNTARPVHSYTASIMSQQGVIRDPIRGPISSSASREPSSRVGWGVSTPGRPIYEGGYDDQSLPSNLNSDDPKGLKVVARRGGHSIVMDDGDMIGRDQLVRIRTSLGHQILMSDDGQTLMILHSNGQSYIELGKEGTIDMYSTNSVNIRTQGDLNLHADQNINIHAMENFNLQAKNIHTNSEEVTQMRAVKDFKIGTSAKFSTLAADTIAINAGGDIGVAAGGISYVSGSKVNLNTGSGPSADSVNNIPITAHTDTLFDEQKGFLAAPGKLLSITSRAPAHAPWANAGQGVDVKTNLNASDNLPQAPSEAVAATTEAGAETGAQAPAVATIASAPNVPPVSKALDKGTTNAMLGSVAKSAAEGPLKDAVTKGAAIIATAAGKIAAIGAFAQTLAQLEQGGVIKPGSATMINGLIQNGASIKEAMPASVFTGKPGAQNIDELIRNVSAQAEALTVTMQKSQAALCHTGIITGKESPTQLAGLVTAAATTGVDSTVGAVQQVNGTVNKLSGVIDAANGVTTNLGSISGSNSGPLPGVVNAGADSGAVNQVSSALAQIGAGSAAANLASTKLGGMAGIASALAAMEKIPALSGLLNQSKGISGSAFEAIKKSMGTIKPNVPQNLTKLSKDQAVETAETAAKSPENLKDAKLVAGKASDSASNSKNLLDTVKAVATVANSIPGVPNQVSDIIGKAPALLTDINNISKNVNNAGSTVNTKTATVDGVTGVATSSVTNSIASNTNAGKEKNVANTAITGVNAVAGASPTLANGGLPALSSAAKEVQTGKTAVMAASMASGLSKLPGGMDTVASVNNKATPSTNNIPGTNSISGTIKDLTSAAMNGNSGSDILNKLPLEKGLTTLASIGLPVGDIAKLQSAVAALTSGTAGTVKLPSIGFNTTDRKSITSQINNIIGDPGIPKPNLTGEISESSKEELAATVEKATENYETTKKKFDSLIADANKAKQEYIDAENNYPEGDPRIENARNKYIEASKAMNEYGSKVYLPAFNAYDAAKDAQLANKLTAINTATTPEQLRAAMKG